MLLVRLVAWVARVTVFQPEGWRQTAAISGSDGVVVVLAVAAVYLAVLAVAAWSASGTRMRESKE